MRTSKIIKWGLLSLGLFLLFLVLTFPYDRLGPRVEDGLEQALRQSLGRQVDCRLEGFNLSLPLGFSWDNLGCQAGRSRELFQLGEGQYRFYLTSHSLETKIGGGTFELGIDGGLGIPSALELKLDEVPIESFLPGALLIANRFNPRVPVDLKVQGQALGELDFPVKNIHEGSGRINLQLTNLKFPKQPLLDLVGLNELTFSKAVLQAKLEEGRLETEDIEAKSSIATGKAEGFIQFEEEVLSSNADLDLKWKIQESDALLSTPFGQIIINAPCPSPDAQRFCTRRVTRLDRLFSF